LMTPDELRLMVMEPGAAESVKAGWAADATVRDTVVVWVCPPPVPVMVML